MKMIKTSKSVVLMSFIVVTTTSIISHAEDSLHREITESKINAVMAEQKTMSNSSPEDLLITAENHLNRINSRIETIGKSTDNSKGLLTRLGQKSFIIEMLIEEMHQDLQDLYSGKTTYAQAQTQMATKLKEILKTERE